MRRGWHSKTVWNKNRELDRIVTAERQKRHDELVNALAEKGLHLRADSSMCRSYVDTGHGVNGEPLSHVVDIMHEMTWLYAHTRYSHCVESIKDEYRDNGEWYNINNVVNEAKVLATRSWFAEVAQHKTWDELETTLPTRVLSRLTKPTQL